MSGQASSGTDGENAAEDDESNQSGSGVAAGVDQADGTNSNILDTQIGNDHDKEVANDYLLYEQNSVQNGGPLG